MLRLTETIAKFEQLHASGEIDFCDEDMIDDLYRLKSTKNKDLLAMVLDHVLEEHISHKFQQPMRFEVKEEAIKKLRKKHSMRTFNRIYEAMEKIPSFSDEQNLLAEKIMEAGQIVDILDEQGIVQILPQLNHETQTKVLSFTECPPLFQKLIYDHWSDEFLEIYSTEFTPKYDSDTIDQAIAKIERMDVKDPIKKAMTTLCRKSTNSMIYAQYVLAEDPEQFRRELNTNQTLDQVLQEKGIDLEIYHKGIIDPGRALGKPEIPAQQSAIVKVKAENLLAESKKHIIELHRDPRFEDYIHFIRESPATNAYPPEFWRILNENKSYFSACETLCFENQLIEAYRALDVNRKLAVKKDEHDNLMSHLKDVIEKLMPNYFDPQGDWWDEPEVKPHVPKRLRNKEQIR